MPVLVLATAFIASGAATSGAWLYMHFRDRVLGRKLLELVDSEEDTLLCETLEEMVDIEKGLNLCSAPSNLKMICSEGTTGHDYNIPVGTRNGTFIMDQSPMDVKQHRRVREKLSCVREMIATCKCEFIDAKDTSANRKAIARYAKNVLKEHGVRPSHIARMLPLIIVGTLVPSKHEVTARLAYSSGPVRERLDFYKSIRGPSDE